MDPIHIILSSTPSTAQDSLNTQTSFTTTLPIPFICEDNYAIALESIVIDNNFGVGESPQLIKVNLSCLSEQTVAIIANGNNKVPLQIVLRRKEYFRLNTSLLNKISVILTDENNLPLSITGGNPTLLHLKIRKMNADLILRISSENSTNLFVNNSQNEFKVLLQSANLDSRKQYEMAVSSAFLPPSINLKKIFKNKEEFWMTFNTTNDYLHYITFEEIDKPTLFKMFAQMRSRIIEEEYENVLTVEVDEVDGNEVLVMEASEIIHIRFSPRLAFLLNLTPIHPMKHETNVFKITMNNENRRLLVTLNLTRCIPQALFLFSDNIIPNMINSGFEKNLKILLYAENKNKRYVRCDIQHLDFVSFTFSEPFILDFKLCDCYGEKIYFLETYPVLLTIFIREKIY